ncbi:MAG: tetratricopeptide repeat protein [FCB group bacterium]|jgi:tetratricopeptide (TPR) repeat protein|nr:tetratricopeptide repeat protein [FCB group bacterium]
MSTLLLVSIAAVFSFADAPAAPPAAALPEELSSLNLLWEDEEKLVEGVRQFDLVQLALVDWDQELAQQHDFAGDAALAKEKLAEAKRRVELVRRAYEEVLKRYPNNARARVYLGEVYYDRMHDEGLGVKLWQEALSLDSKLHEAMNNLSIHYSHVGEPEKALDYLEKALELAPKNADYLFNAAQLYLVHFPVVRKRHGWTVEQVYRRAMEFSRRAVEARPDDYPLVSDYAFNFFWGAEKGFKTDWREAASVWQKARSIARNRDELFNSWLNEGRVWVRAGDQAKAAACVEEAIKIYPDSASAKNLLAGLKAGG